MAFTYCTNCGEKIDMDNARCPYCGHVRQEYSYGKEPFSHSENEQKAQADQGQKSPYSYEEDGYSRQNRDYGQDHGYGQQDRPYGRDGYGQSGQNYGHGGYGFGGEPNGQRPLYRTPGSRMPQKRPISIGLTLFSIINILFSCCAFPSLIFGILALFNTVQAQNATSEEEEIAKKKTALVLNVVGAVLTVLTVVSFSVVFAEALAQYVSNGGV